MGKLNHKEKGANEKLASIRFNDVSFFIDAQYNLKISNIKVMT